MAATCYRQTRGVRVNNCLGGLPTVGGASANKPCAANVKQANNNAMIVRAQLPYTPTESATNITHNKCA